MSTSAVIRGHLVRMVLWILVLHAVAVALHYAVGVATAPRALRSTFMVAWLTATVVVVSIYLRRIRLARRGYQLRRGDAPR